MVGCDQFRVYYLFDYNADSIIMCFLPILKDVYWASSVAALVI